MWRCCKKTCFGCKRPNYSKVKSKSSKIFWFATAGQCYSDIFFFKVLQGLAKTEEVIDIAKKGNVKDTALEDQKNLKCGDAARKLAMDATDVDTMAKQDFFAAVKTSEL